MKQLLIVLLSVVFPQLIFAQIIKSDEIFTTVQTFDGEVVFIKEILPKEDNQDKNYAILKNWAKANFAKDPFNSSVSYDSKNKSITAQSRIELLYPEDSRGIRQKMIMKYRLNVFFENGLCIFEMTKISYINDAKANGNTLPQKIKAEDIVTDKAIVVDDAGSRTRKNTKESTIYFVNDLVNSLQKLISY